MGRGGELMKRFFNDSSVAMVTGVPVTRYGARLTRTPNLWFSEAIDDIVEIIYSTERVSLLLLFLFGLTSEMLHLLRDTYLMEVGLYFI